jgi:hypothetical protein
VQFKSVNGRKYHLILNSSQSFDTIDGMLASCTHALNQATDLKRWRSRSVTANIYRSTLFHVIWLQQECLRYQREMNSFSEVPSSVWSNFWNAEFSSLEMHIQSFEICIQANDAKASRRKCSKAFMKERNVDCTHRHPLWNAPSHVLE